MNDKQQINLTYDDALILEDIEYRKLYLNDCIDETVITQIAYYILRYNRMDKDIPVKDRKPIVLFINSVGGSVSDGWGLIDAIITSKTPVYTVNLALCASMAFLVYIAGHERYSMPHAEFLMHDGMSGVIDSTAKARDRMDFETDQLEVMTKEFVIEHTKISDELYDKQYRREWWFLPTEGKNIGAIDYIIGKDCEIDTLVN